jgi:hypothetical protein
VVHETNNHEKKSLIDKGRAYYWVEIINPFDCRFYLSCHYEVTDGNAILNRLDSHLWLNVGFLGEFLCGIGISFTKKVVHDDGIDVSERLVSLRLELMVRSECDCQKEESEGKKKFFVIHRKFSVRFPLANVHH